MKSTFIRAFVAAVLTIIVTVNASASLLYVVDNSNPDPNSTPSNTTATDSSIIMTYDTETDIETVLNSNTDHKLNDIAVTANGSIYAIGGSSMKSTRYIYRYDASGVEIARWTLESGSITAVGLTAQSNGSLIMTASDSTNVWRINLDSYGNYINTINLGPTNGVYTTGDIAVSPDGVLYFIGSTESRSDTSILYTLDLSGATPVATPINPIKKIATPLDCVYGLTFDSEGALFCARGHRNSGVLSQTVYQLDPVTAQAVVVKSLTEANGILGLASVLPATWNLNISVVGGHGTVLPASGSYSNGTVVNLTATPDPNYQVKAWHGTNNDSSTSTTNTVTMNTYKTVTVEFETIKTATPVIKPNGGEFAGLARLALSCATSDSNMYYTTDGNEPNESSSHYTGPFTIHASGTVQTQAFNSRTEDSDVADAPFTITPNHWDPNGGDMGYDFTGVFYLWDISGSYSTVIDALVADHNNLNYPVTLRYTITQDTKGKILGTAIATICVDRGNYVDIPCIVKGAVSLKNGVAMVKLSIKGTGTATIGDIVRKVTFTETLNKGVINPTSKQITGDVKIGVSVQSQKAQKAMVPFTASLSQNMDGSSVLYLHCAPDLTGKSLIGTAELMLPGGGSYDFTVKGKYNAKNDESDLALKGIDKGNSLKIKVDHDGHIISLKGKVLGQSIKIVELLPG